MAASFVAIASLSASHPASGSTPAARKRSAPSRTPSIDASKVFSCAPNVSISLGSSPSCGRRSRTRPATSAKAGSVGKNSTSRRRSIAARNSTWRASFAP